MAVDVRLRITPGARRHSGNTERIDAGTAQQLIAAQVRRENAAGAYQPDADGIS
jgi:hypothetical protein